MTTNFVQIPPNSTGLKIDTNELTVNSQIVERQSVCLADPLTAANVANVLVGTNPTQYYSGVATAPLDGYKATYAAAFIGVSAGTVATTDFFTLFGSATKTIRVLQFALGGTIATTAQYTDFLVQVCSAAPTSGVATTLTVVPYDSNDAAGTGVAKVWTTPPSAATYVGKISASRYPLLVTGTVPTIGSAYNIIQVFDFTKLPARVPVLRGVAQGLSLSFNATTFGTATTFDGYVIWTEE